jgi:hypothetical protein
MRHRCMPCLAAQVHAMPCGVGAAMWPAGRPACLSPTLCPPARNPALPARASSPASVMGVSRMLSARTRGSTRHTASLMKSQPTAANTSSWLPMAATCTPQAPGSWWAPGPVGTWRPPAREKLLLPQPRPRRCCRPAAAHLAALDAEAPADVQLPQAVQAAQEAPVADVPAGAQAQHLQARRAR